MGRATEALAERLGGGIGGLLNATFGNAAELIIGALALREGHVDLVKASLTGSIIGNVLLVFGAAALVGGLKHTVQSFNRTAAGLGSTMLLLSAIGLVVPAVFHRLAHGTPTRAELTLDTEIAVVLLVTYVRQPGVHAADASRPVRRADARAGQPTRPRCPSARWCSCWSPPRSASRSSASCWSARWRRPRTTLGMTELFVGVVIVALVGNAAEHYSAVTMAADDQMDVALAIAVGSSTQIALFVAPVLVLPQLPDRAGSRWTCSSRRSSWWRSAMSVLAIVVHRPRRRDALDGRRAAAGGLPDPRARLLLPPGKSKAVAGVSIVRYRLPIEMPAARAPSPASPVPPESAEIERRIAARLGRLRTERGWSLEVLAERSGISRATLSRLERGELSPTASMLGRLCTTFGWTLSRLMADAETRAPNLVPASQQAVWTDPETGYRRRIVSPPAPGLRGELVEIRIPAGATVGLRRLAGAGPRAPPVAARRRPHAGESTAPCSSCGRAMRCATS